MMAGAPVVISDNGIGFPVTPVEENAPVLTVAENGIGTPVVLTDNSSPFIVEGLSPPPIPGPLNVVVDTTGNSTLEGTYDLAADFMALGVAFRYSGTLTSISASHGGEPLTLVHSEIRNGVGSALFIGNGLTIGTGQVVVTPTGGATLGPAMMRMNDDYGYTTIASGWDGGSAQTNVASVLLTVTQPPTPGNVLVVAASKMSQSPRVTGANPPMQNGLVGYVTAGTPVAIDAHAVGTGWHENSGEYEHIETEGSGVLSLSFSTIPDSAGVKITYSASRLFYLKIMRTPSSGYNVACPAGSNVTLWAETMPGVGSYVGMEITATGDVEISEITPLASPTTLHGILVRSNGDVPIGWTTQFRQAQSVDFAISAIEVHGEP